MKTDRELLELAAKAAGIELLEWDEEGQAYWIDQCLGEWWTPLLFDGDAFRLAVQLKLDVLFFDGFHEVHAGGDGITSAAVESYSDHMAYATRRAIVRAAAAIGEAMK